MAQPLDVLPGDRISSSNIPHSEKKKLKLGPGLHHIPPSTIKATVAGALHSDFRKNAIWVDYDGGRVSILNREQNAFESVLTGATLYSTFPA